MCLLWQANMAGRPAGAAGTVSLENKRRIIALRQEGLTFREIGRQVGVHPSTVSK